MHSLGASDNISNASSKYKFEEAYTASANFF